jgi:hypothetical protein|tara:strand:+ start:86 stop:499 length:414 start_codon:yes stop_codon:yes gene_type:complete
MSTYEIMVSVEQDREKKDLLYHIINNCEAKTLDDICDRIVLFVLEKYPGASLRLKQMLRKVQQTEDRVGKHALVFFALEQEPECRNIFLPDTPRVPPQKFQHFIEKDLPILVEKLTNGAFTSLRAFAEDTRWTYCTL